MFNYSIVEFHLVTLPPLLGIFSTFWSRPSTETRAAMTHQARARPEENKGTWLLAKVLNHLESVERYNKHVCTIYACDHVYIGRYIYRPIGIP